MITVETVRQLALAFEEAIEEPHFEKTSYRIRKKIFATVDVVNRRLCIKLSLIDESAFSSYNKEVVYPIPNKWGKLG